ncbi:MAG: hypothetical protein JJT96_19060 [Opitutales bacterium]|nr:hypothetical protein [Opitutales bacterium]
MKHPKDRRRFEIREMKSGAKTIWQVQGYDLEGNRVRKRFDIHERAKGFQQEMNVEVMRDSNFRAKLTRLSDDEIDDAEQAIVRLPEGKRLVDAVDHFIRTYVEPKEDTLLSRALEEFAEDENLLLHMREKSREAIRIQVRLFARLLGADARMSQILPRHVDEWTARDTLSTRRTRRAKLSSFFNWCLTRGYLGRNPITGSDKAPERRQRLERDPVFLSVPDTIRLLRSAQATAGGALVPYFALHLFGGLRAEELKRMTWEAINLETGYILLSAPIAKTAARRTVKISENLHAWLVDHAVRRPPIIPRNFRKLFERVRREAGIEPWVRDVGRHTALTYHYAVSGLKSITTAWAGNSPGVLDTNYRGLATLEEAQEYWSITPASLAVTPVVDFPAASAS